MNIILSIKPKWAELIYSGKKTIEWRKSFPKRENIECVYLYETAPVKKVTGFFYWENFVTLYFLDPIPKEYKNLPHSTQKIIDAGCVPFEDLKKYKGDGIKLFGWKIKNPQKYKEPLPLSMFNFEKPPQSWCYDYSDLPF
jgi:predicted transcriptional regulator